MFPGALSAFLVGGAPGARSLPERHDTYGTPYSAMAVSVPDGSSAQEFANVLARDPFRIRLLLFVVLWMWGYPRLHVAYIQRIIGWQGEYRATVAAAGITCHSDYSTLVQKWSVYQGYRETAHHFVLLSRDPNIMGLEVLPKRGVHEAEDLDRLRAILDQHTTRV